MRLTRSLVVLACAGFAFAPSCACEDAYGVDAEACVEVEDRQVVDGNSDGVPDDGVDLEAGVTGTIVEDIGFPASPNGLTLCATGAIDDIFDHSLVIDPGGGARRVRVRWGHPNIESALAFDAPVGSAVTIENVFVTDEGALSFVLRDDDGLAFAFNGADALNELDGTRIVHGQWRGSSWAGCGFSSATTTSVITPDATHDVANGESADVVINGTAMRFHAFATIALGPGGVCPDATSKRNWMLIKQSR
jgi:hypothetical protein